MTGGLFLLCCFIAGAVGGFVGGCVVCIVGGHIIKRNAATRVKGWVKWPN